MSRATWHDGMNAPVTLGDTAVTPISPNRLSVQPLLHFGSTDALPTTALSPSAAAARSTKTRSVFGVDTVWERELKNLREQEEAERQAKEDEEAAKQVRREKKERRKNKKREKGNGREVDVEPGREGTSPALETQEEPVKEAPRPRRSSIDLLRTAGPSVQDWAASSDEEGQRPRRSRTRQSRQRVDSDSDSDEPLSRIKRRQSRTSLVPPKQTEMAVEAESESSSDDEPLARIVVSLVPSSTLL